MAKRDYNLLGADSRRALESGLAGAKWYQSEVPREVMRALLARRDGPATRDTVILFGAMAAFGGAGIMLWPSWWCAPFWLAYGVIYGSAMDSRWHECGHGTAFRTKWKNDVVYQIASFCMVRNPVEWRWSHARHHTDTIIVGRDPEILAMRPPAMRRIILNLFGIVDVMQGWRRMAVNAAGHIDADIATFIPDREKPKLIATARVWCAIYLGVLALCLATASPLPLMVIGLPRLYGAWHHVLTGILQHAGLAENVTDHRLNTRTILLNPISRFLYWNMNYHVEHHMFPTVPYHALPAFHERIKHDLPAPNTSMLQALAEVLPALWRQLRNEDYFITRTLPKTATAYRNNSA